MLCELRDDDPDFSWSVKGSALAGKLGFHVFSTIDTPYGVCGHVKLEVEKMALTTTALKHEAPASNLFLDRSECEQILGTKRLSESNVPLVV